MVNTHNKEKTTLQWELGGIGSGDKLVKAMTWDSFNGARIQIQVSLTAGSIFLQPH